MILALMAAAALAIPDPYKVLGVSRDADDKQIRKAFKARSLKHHPDRNPDPKSKQRFQKISNAYQLLKDPQKRRIYDQTGEDPDRMGMNNGGGGGGFGGFNRDGFSGGGFNNGGFGFGGGGFGGERVFTFTMGGPGGHGGGFGMDDILRMMGGGGFQQQQQFQQGYQQQNKRSQQRGQQQRQQQRGQQRTFYY